MNLRWLRRRGPDAPSGTPVPDAPPGETTADPEGGEISTAPRVQKKLPRPGGIGAEETSIAGERTIPSVNRERSMRSLVSQTLAIGTLAVLAGGALVWYYASQLARADDAKAAAQRADSARSAGEMKLPPLGHVDPPKPAAPIRPVSATMTSFAADSVIGPPPPPPANRSAFGTTSTSQPGPAAKNPKQLALERELGQPVMLRSASPQSTIASDRGLSMPLPSGALNAGLGSPLSAPTATSLGTLLRPTATPAVAAQLLPTRRFLLAKGAFVDCTLETAIDSTFDGMVTCIGASDVYSADGKIVLLERGTKYVGEKRGEVRQGQGRVFVLWNEARTPTGVVVNLASPGTDELGRTGLPGAIDTHFWERFGAAILISVIDGTLEAIAANQQGSGTSVVLSPRGAHDIMTEVLKSTIAIPPTVVKNQGDRVQVLVARDVDFRSVYALRSDERE